MHPLRPIRGRDRIAWISAPVACRLPLPDFTPGRSYPAELLDGYRETLETRLSHTGAMESVSVCERALVVALTGDSGARHAFAEGEAASYTFGLQGMGSARDFTALEKAFEIPQPPTIAEARPEAHAEALARLGELEMRFGVSLRAFQREDLALAALVDGLVLAWDKGLGKTLAAILWPLLKGASHTLLVIPESLHRQIRDESRDLFGISLPSLDSRPAAPHGFCLAGYYELARLTPARREALGDVFDCIVADEATQIKSETAALARAVRDIPARLRLALTATPVKNKIADLFWLAHWARPGALPYEADTLGQREFAADFSATEVSDSREREKSAPRICDTLRLRRLLAPIILRRSKADCGEPLVAKRFAVHLSPMGTGQAAAYRRFLAHPPIAREGRPITCASTTALQMQILRQVALSPDAPSLAGYTLADAPPFSPAETDLTPKTLDMVRRIAALLAEGEQALVFTPFQHFARALHERLARAGVPTCRMDGSISAARRGDLSAAFKRREYAVAICSLESMAAGASFPQCRHLFLPGLVWAFDRNDQAIDRIHRLVSERDVTIHLCVAAGSIDEVLLRDFLAKASSSSSVLDGDPAPPLDAGAALAAARDLSATTMRDERDLVREWDSAIAPALAHGARAFLTASALQAAPRPRLAA